MAVYRGVQLTSANGRTTYFIPDAELRKFKERASAAGEFTAGAKLEAYQGTHPKPGKWSATATVGVE